jgi:hypothetical protein
VGVNDWNGRPFNFACSHAALRITIPTITPSTALGDVTPSRANATTIPGQKKRSTKIAAAAYNAGPQRIQDWLLANGGLPNETRRYVLIVTGRSPEEWSGGTTKVT